NSKRTNNLLDSRETCRSVVRRLVTLDLLLLQAETLSQLSLRETKGDARLDKKPREFRERGRDEFRLPSGLQGLVIGDFLFQFIELALKRRDLRVAQDRVGVTCRAEARRSKGALEVRRLRLRDLVFTLVLYH